MRHVPVAVVCPSGEVRLLGTDPGVPLGVVDHLERDDEGCRLAPGSTVVMVTDGVVESRQLDVQEGIDLFVARVGELAGAPLAEIVAGVAAGPFLSRGFLTPSTSNIDHAPRRSERVLT